MQAELKKRGVFTYFGFAMISFLFLLFGLKVWAEEKLVKYIGVDGYVGKYNCSDGKFDALKLEIDVKKGKDGVSRCEFKDAPFYSKLDLINPANQKFLFVIDGKLERCAVLEKDFDIKFDPGKGLVDSRGNLIKLKEYKRLKFVGNRIQNGVYMLDLENINKLRTEFIFKVDLQKIDGVNVITDVKSRESYPDASYSLKRDEKYDCASVEKKGLSYEKFLYLLTSALEGMYNFAGGRDVQVDGRCMNMTVDKYKKMCADLRFYARREDSAYCNFSELRVREFYENRLKREENVKFPKTLEYSSGYFTGITRSPVKGSAQSRSRDVLNIYSHRGLDCSSYKHLSMCALCDGVVDRFDGMGWVPFAEDIAARYGDAKIGFKKGGRLIGKYYSYDALQKESPAKAAPGSGRALKMLRISQLRPFDTVSIGGHVYTVLVVDKETVDNGKGRKVDLDDMVIIHSAGLNGKGKDGSSISGGGGICLSYVCEGLDRKKAEDMELIKKSRLYREIDAFQNKYLGDWCKKYPGVDIKPCRCLLNVTPTKTANLGVYRLSREFFSDKDTYFNADGTSKINSLKDLFAQVGLTF